MADDPADREFFKQFEAEARRYSAEKNRELTEQTRFATTRPSRSFERRDNPASADERHRAENAANHNKLLEGIKDTERRSAAREQIEKHYKAWKMALFKAYNERFDNSQRLYERKIKASKTDERLIPPTQKEKLREDSIREAVAQSNNRIKEINAAIPVTIDRTIATATKQPMNRALDKDAQRAKDAADTYKARAGRASRERGDKDLER